MGNITKNLLRDCSSFLEARTSHELTMSVTPSVRHSVTPSEIFSNEVLISIVNGLAWSPMVFYGAIWSCLVPYGLVWSRMVTYGTI